MEQRTELKKAGLKVTLPRLKILEILEESDERHLSAAPDVGSSAL